MSNPINRLYVNNEELLRLGEVQEYTAWYNGNSSELLEFYTEAINTYYAGNPIYTRNKRQYFWARAVDSKRAFRRTHDNLFADIIDVLTNIVGTPTLVATDLESDNSQFDKDTAEKLVDALDIWHTINQKQLPLSLAQGTGCFKVSSDMLQTNPSLEYYPADRLRYHARHGNIYGIDFTDYLTDDNGKTYALVEKRYLTGNEVDGSGDLHIEYHLYTWNGYTSDKNNEQSLDTLEETRWLEPSTIIPKVGKLFATPTTILMDKRGGVYGRSIGEGKLDLLDMLDETWSIEGRCVRLSTPQTYMPESLLRTSERDIVDGDGNHDVQIIRNAPDEFDRDFVITGDDVIPNGDGRMSTQGIVIDQPHMDVDQYHKTRQRAIIEILNGIMSSATLGVYINPNMNEPMESREREKITTLTRTIIVDREKRILESVLTDLLDMADYKRDGVFYLRAENATPRVQVRFSEFANPSLETELKVLGNAWSAGQISTELYVENLWRDRLTDTEKEAEKKRLDDARREAILAPALYEGKNVENLEEILENGIAGSDIADDDKQGGVSGEGKVDSGEDVGEPVLDKESE